MRVVFQRVKHAAVRVDSEAVAQIGPGALLLVGVADNDGVPDAQRLAGKCADLRVFADGEGKFNLSLVETGGEALVVSQFTLLADVRKGRRPSFVTAAKPEIAEPLVVAFAEALRETGVPVQAGRFGAMMEVELVNDGPVTIVLDSETLERPRRG